MKTISDIKDALEVIDNETRKYSQDACNRAMELFKDIPEINKLISDLENMSNGEYSIDDHGELIYSVEVPKEIADLPFINDYLTHDFGHLTGKRHNDLRLAQTCGLFVSINWNCSREYFVFDHDCNKEIVKKSDLLEEGHPTITDDSYVAAKIELYQESKGEFGDVIEIDYHGGYLKHFDTNRGLSKEELKTLINTYEEYGNE